jgi:predicted ATPase
MSAPRSKRKAKTVKKAVAAIKERISRLVLVIGTNGTGKTTFLLKAVTAAAATRRVLVVDFENAERAWQPFEEIDPADREAMLTFTGVRRINWAKHDDATLSLLRKYYRNGILVLDDCRTYLKASMEDELHQLLIRRRQYMLDIFVVAHSFQDVPPKFYQFSTDVVLFRITRPIDDRKRMLANPTQILAAHERIQRQAQTNPHYYEIIR